MRLIVVAVLLFAAMAGCADRADTISAREGLAPARDAAKAHGDDPVLIGITAIEPFQHLAEDDYEVWVHLDKNPGDGRAPGWMYEFASGDRHIGILYAAGLGVLAEGYETQEEPSFDAPLTDWVLDSTDVARILAKHEDWPASAQDTTVFWSLRQDEGGPVWFVEWDNATSSTEAMVDARTGNVSQVASIEFGPTHIEVSPERCDDAFSMGGDVSPLQGRSLSIEVADGGFLEYTFQWSMTLGEATMTISGPDGEIKSDTLSGNGQAMGNFSQLESGTYTLDIEAELGLGEATGLFLWSCP